MYLLVKGEIGSVQKVYTGVQKPLVLFEGERVSLFKFVYKGVFLY